MRPRARRIDMSGWRDATTPNTARSLILMSAGAAVGLGLAGYGLFTARGTSTLHVPPEDVALVNQQPISRVDFLAQLQSLYGVDLQHSSPTERKKVLDDMIREELFVQRGKELDVASTDFDVRNAMVNAVELEIAADALSSAPTEVQLKSYYKEHAEHYAKEGIMTVQDYVFPLGQLDSATAASAAFAATPPTVEAAARFNGKPSAKMGDEQFYFAAQIHLGQKLFDLARTMADRSASAPVSMPDGIHVLYMLHNDKPFPLQYAEARDQVLNDYRNASISHLRLGDEAFLLKRANVLIADDLR
jgi:hypothetical protein